MSDVKKTNNAEWSGRPRRGDFGWQPLVSTFEPTLDDMMSDRPYFGMPPEALYLWGTMRDEDGEIYTIMRRLPSDRPGAAKDTRRYFYLQSTAGHTDALHLHPAGRGSAPNDGHTKTLEDGRVHWRSAADVPGNPFHVTWAPDSCSWKEEGVIDLTGKLIPPGMHWYLPGRHAGMYYVANIFQMEGVVLGKKVRGLIGFDPVYMPEGGEVYKTKDALVQEKLELVWYTWATVYKDGSIEAGHFMLGNDQLGFAIITDEKGNARFTYEVAGEVTHGPEGYWQEHIKLSAFGEEWEFIPDARGRMPDLGPIPNPQVDGRWRRVGDDREPDIWFAWGETAPGHGSRPVNRLPGLGERVSIPVRKFNTDTQRS